MLDTHLAEELKTEEVKSGNGASSRLVGPYALRREIGRGGMSVVYEAWDTRTGSEVALKLLSVPSAFSGAEADRLVSRFEREARTMARLPHPNIISVYEIGAADGQHFLAMEYLRGQTLRERLSRGKLPLGEAFAILTQVAGAMDAVHHAGVVHRDIKAANVMLLPGGTAKLLDFGIAHSSEEAALTHVNAVIGTPAYMAPEQVRGEPASAATDLWSLGVLAYEMFAGHAPFGGPIVANVLFQVTSRPPVPAPHLPKAVQKVLRRALDKDPARRYPTAATFIEAVKSALPKSVLPSSPSAKRKPAVKLPAITLKLRPITLPSVDLPKIAWSPPPRWAQGTALLLLLVGAFSVAAHQWHPVRSIAPRQVSTRAAAVSPAVAALPVPVVLAPAVRSAPQATGPYWVKTEKPPQAAPPSADVPSREASDTENAPQSPGSSSAQAGTEGNLSRTAQSDETPLPQPRSRRPADLSAESGTSRQNAGDTSQNAASDTPRSDAPPQAQTPVQAPIRYQPLYQAAPPQAPVQDAPQAATLPDGNSSDDPETAARLRKRGWSQSGDASGQ